MVNWRGRPALLTFPWVDSMITMGFTLGPLTCGYDWDLVICRGQRGSSWVPRVVEGSPLACPQSCPKGPWRLAGPGWRLAPSRRPGGPGESHPRAPTERNVTVSRHSALLI
jgi:hypothetical protein